MNTARHGLRATASVAWCLSIAVALGACGDDAADAGGPAPDGGSLDAGGASPPPVDPEAAARGFKLYYKERLHRALTAYNRFQMVGGSNFALGTGNPFAKNQGDDIEIVTLLSDNNKFGTAMFNTYYAYKHFRTRELELTLLRMLEGLIFYEGVTGHPGLTSRDVRPGWTRVMDGIAGTVTLTRDGEPFTSPLVPGVDIEAEVLEAFYRGVRITYRENPADFMLDYLPAANVVGYSITHSFAVLPGYIPNSDCCATSVQTPEGFTWAGAFWSNHNSRDNWPDIGLGYVAAQLVKTDPDASGELREVAGRAVEAGKRIGDLVFDSGGNLMTVSEHGSYDELVLSGGIRPHGLSENEDLGSLANCPDAYLAKALSTDGLTLPVPEIPVPGAVTVEQMLVAGTIDCEPDPDRTCKSLADGFCGFPWSESDKLKSGGMPFLDLVRTLEEASPGAAETLLGRFQGDFEHIVESMVAIIHWSWATGDRELADETGRAVKDMTDLMREFAEVIWPDPTHPDGIRQRAEAARLDAMAGVEVIGGDLGEFEAEEERVARIEGLLDLADTTPDPLMTDAEILDKVEARLAELDASDHPSGREQVIYDRYRDAYGMEPPVRRAGDGYEARRHDTDWASVEVPQHTWVSGRELFSIVPLCETAPEIVDCRWAALGCARPDLDADGTVDSKDLDAFEADFEDGRSCDEDDDWCGGIDLDRSGTLDALDEAFIEAAEGCRYEP